MKLVERRGVTVLCLSDHADDVEMGAATILGWIARGARFEVHWTVLSAEGRHLSLEYEIPKWDGNLCQLTSTSRPPGPGVQ